MPRLLKLIVSGCLTSGSLASSIFDPLSGLVGASGGVYALIGGYFMNAVVVSLRLLQQEQHLLLWVQPTDQIVRLWSCCCSGTQRLYI